MYILQHFIIAVILLTIIIGGLVVSRGRGLRHSVKRRISFYYIFIIIILRLLQYLTIIRQRYKRLFFSRIFLTIRPIRNPTLIIIIISLGQSTIAFLFLQLLLLLHREIIQIRPKNIILSLLTLTLNIRKILFIFPKQLFRPQIWLIRKIIRHFPCRSSIMVPSDIFQQPQNYLIMTLRYIIHAPQKFLPKIIILPNLIQPFIQISDIMGLALRFRMNRINRPQQYMTY